jgi:hypothetical protein
VKSGECSEAEAFEVKRLIEDMTTHQTKTKGQPPSQAYSTRRDWLAFLKEVTKFHFNPLMPNKSGKQILSPFTHVCFTAVLLL